MSSPTALNYDSLAAGQLPSSKGTLYTAPALTEIMVQSLIITNNGGGDNTVDIYLKLMGGTTEVHIIPWLIHDKNVIVLSNFTLSPGDLIEGKATNASQVDYAITGGEAT